MGTSGLQIIKTVNYEGKISIYFGFQMFDFGFTEIEIIGSNQIHKDKLKGDIAT